MNLREAANMASLREAAELTGVHLPSLVGAVARGLVPHVRNHGTGKGRRSWNRYNPVIFVDLEDVEAWLLTRGPRRKRPAQQAYERLGDVYALARERGIKVKSAMRVVQRWRKAEA